MTSDGGGGGSVLWPDDAAATERSAEVAALRRALQAMYAHRQPQVELWRQLHDHLTHALQQRVEETLPEVDTSRLVVKMGCLTLANSSHVLLRSVSAADVVEQLSLSSTSLSSTFSTGPASELRSVRVEAIALDGRLHPLLARSGVLGGSPDNADVMEWRVP